MQRLHVSILFLCLCGLSLTGCERSADLDNRKHYSERGISFVYPGNWRVESDETDVSGVRTILVETPGDAIAVIQQFRLDPATDLDSYARLFADLTKQEIPIGQVSPSTFKPYSYKLKHADESMVGIQENFAITLVGERVPHVRAYFGFDETLPNTVVICQVATEDLAKVKPGCDLLLDHIKIEAP